ncbi:MAG: hypothetical protein IJ457_03630 [Clostridia bacterium]|nr:hypothetical protein [Clostridia bacterium]
MNYTYLDKKYELSPEMQRVVDEVEPRMFDRNMREGTFTGAPYDCREPFLDVFEEMPDAPYAIALAHAIVRSWTTSTIAVLPGEIIVGTTRPFRRFAEHFSYGIEDQGWCVQNDENYKKMADSVGARYEALKSRMVPGTYEAMEAAGREFFGKEEYEHCGSLMWTGGYQGHTIPGYPKLFGWGLDRTIEEINKYDANTNDEKKHELYAAMRIIVEGLSAFAILHADRAAELAAAETDEYLKKTYLLVEKNCRKIAHDKPENLLEAVQLMWFYSLWDWVDSLGRADQYFYPYYVNGVDEVPKDDIIASFILKIREHGAHNMTLGGVRPEDGENATNELTFLMLQILRTYHDTHPRVAVRIDKSTPKEVMDLIVKMWSEGMSDPTIVSDTLVIDGLRDYGVSLEDARDYATLGCQEIEIPGKSNFGCEDGSFNLAKVLEYTLNNGRDVESGMKIGLDTGSLASYNSVEEIYEAFVKQIEYLTPIFTELCSLGQTLRDKNLSKLVKSVYTDDCIARGINQDAGGTVYNYGVVETAGLAVVADALAALETVVFGDGRVTKEQLAEALKTNFEGHEDIRQIMLAAPKFGNDLEVVDKWAARVLEMFWSEIRKYKSIRGGVYMGACSLLGGGISYGRETWALPDGHRKGDPLGNTMGPRPGADKSGLTAMLKSVTKLPLHLGLGGTTLNVLIPCKETDSDEKRAKIAALFRAYMANGGQLAQITTASLEDMQDARIHPELHGDLIVRVGGYSTKFVLESDSVQREIMSRYT